MKYCDKDKRVQSYIQNQLKSKWQKKETREVWINQYMFEHDTETNYFLDHYDKSNYMFGLSTLKLMKEIDFDEKAGIYGNSLQRTMLYKTLFETVNTYSTANGIITNIDKFVRQYFGKVNKRKWDMKSFLSVINIT